MKIPFLKKGKVGKLSEMRFGRKGWKKPETIYAFYGRIDIGAL
ncbi:hypothetical protein DDD_1455 [Nonlabens dokdonensis DSW-6]|uniref:Uncharacterized protein n=1 Tax=Nonlabens dokdonensis (strain DSM 17205 / KCTC 12402 / DSW-6) TaxID=592029 RepID=L7W8N7_NONDD|nr:hypothetical protein DDD_1455 [Nonlabens dokdonensis DSW-6]